jgi:hypothetical protein
MRFESAMLRKAAEAEMRRFGGAGTHPRLEIGEVETGGRHGRVRVAHDQGADEVIIHGVTVSLADLKDHGRAFRAASATFNDAHDAAEQSDAKALIGVVVEAILTRHDWVGAKVRERKFDQRYRV